MSFSYDKMQVLDIVFYSQCQENLGNIVLVLERTSQPTKRLFITSIKQALCIDMSLNAW